MIAAFRAFAKSWIAKVLFVLLIISFGLIFNISDVFGGAISNNVVKAGHRSLTAQEFKQIWERQKDQIEQERGAPIEDAELVAAGIPVRLANEIAGAQSMLSWMESVGVRPADSLTAKALQQYRAFFDPVTGAFDKNQYARLLAEQNIPRKAFEQQLHDDIASRHVAASVSSGLRAPRLYGALQAVYALETRDASWLVVDPSVAGRPAAPTDAQLQALIAENATRLRRPELRTFTIALFNPGEWMGKVTVDPEAVRKQYEFRKESMSQPERRTFVQIPAPSQAVAQRVADALRAGQDPDAVAKAAKLQPIDYTDKPQSAVPDAQVAAAAFSLKPGESSGPINGRLGWAVVKVASVTPGKQVSFEEARGAIEQELRRRAAIEKVETLVQQYDDLRGKGTTLADAAGQVGLSTKTYGPISKDGRGPDGQQVNMPKPVLDSLFSLPKGGESDVGDLGSGVYFALRVDEVRPPAMPTLEELRPEATRAWMLKEQARMLQQKADQLAERVRKGESLQAVAASSGARVQSAQGLGRDPGASKLPPQLVGQVFASAVGKPFTGQVDTMAFAVGKVDAIHPPATVLAARLVEQAAPQIGRSFAGELSELAARAARAKVKPKVYEKKAYQALGVEPPVADAKKKK
jgi:peptidyl-prolyl cis-trans isomerase D